MSANNQSQYIHYEVIGSGPPVVLLHGFGESGRTWAPKGIVKALSPYCRLILVDAPGHGASDKPYDPAAYAIEQLVKDVVAVLDTEDIDQAGIFGYSQGGWIALGMAAFARERVGRLGAGGATPYGQDLSQYRALCGMGLSGALTAIQAVNGRELDAVLRDVFLANDVMALTAAYANDRPDISDLLSGLEIPCMFFAGEVDPLLADMQQLASDIPGARCLTMSGLNHVQAAIRIVTLAPDLVDFFARPD